MSRSVHTRITHQIAIAEHQLARDIKCIWNGINSNYSSWALRWHLFPSFLSHLRTNKFTFNVPFQTRKALASLPLFRTPSCDGQGAIVPSLVASSQMSLPRKEEGRRPQGRGYDPFPSLFVPSTVHTRHNATSRKLKSLHFHLREILSIRIPEGKELWLQKRAAFYSSSKWLGRWRNTFYCICNPPPSEICNPEMKCLLHTHTFFGI